MSATRALTRTLSTDSSASCGTRITPHIADVVFDLYRNPDTDTLSLYRLLKVCHNSLKSMRIF
ncbi:unnamed protein product [Anisakis simplex]|uniref:Uncharacterized protein n=1 Tax=Anisakis simplex TaxID=6269 RepID=A0A0M3J5M7_ANISI|nr:unnamed protein product [Anisakis simplex]